jgi:vacuolar-type H+-ATPase subunit H
LTVKFKVVVCSRIGTPQKSLRIVCQEFGRVPTTPRLEIKQLLELFLFYYMDAFADIMQAETEALNSIETAKKEAGELVAKAREGKTTRLAEVEKELALQASEELASYAKQVEDQASHLATDSQAEVKAVTDKFGAKATDLVAKVKQNLA